MSAVVAITKAQNNELQFDMSVGGTDVRDIIARFVIEGDGVSYVFACKQGDEAAKWITNIPAPTYLLDNKYTFHIEVITNGYYFEPFSGVVNVSDEPQVSLSQSSTPPAPIITDIAISGNPDRSDAGVVLERSTPTTSSDISHLPTNKKQKSPIDKRINDAAMDALGGLVNKPTNQTQSTNNVEVTPPPPLTISLPKHTKKHTRSTPIVESDVGGSRSRLDSIIDDITKPDAQAVAVRNILDIVNSTNKT